MLGILLFVFAWFTDTHISTSTANYNALVDGLADANAQHATFAVVTGDLTDFGTNTFVQSYKQAISTALFPVYSLSGNHDQKWSQTGGLFMRQHTGSDRFSFDYGGIKYIGIPSGPVLRIGGDQVSRENLEWLKKELAQTNPGQKIIALIHHPLTHGHISNGYEVTDILRPYNVQVILGGHVHSYSNNKYDGIPFITTVNSYARTYTLVEVANNMISFSTRSIGGATTPLTTVPLGNYNYEQTALSLPRPNYGINNTYGYVKRRWSYDAGASIYNAPTISGNRMVVCDAAGKVRCFNWSTGALAWSYDANTLFYASAVVDQGKVYVGGMDQYMYCLQLSDGALLWKTYLDGGVMATAAVSSEAVYVATSVNPKIYALNPTNGTILWTTATFSGHVEAAPLVSGQRVYVGSWDGYVRAYARSTGSLLWASKVGTNAYFSAASQSPILHKGTVVLSIPMNSGSNILALDTITGDIAWKSSERMTQAIGISEDRTKYFFKGFYNIRAVNAGSLNNSLTKAWEVTHPDNYDESGSRIAEKGGNVFFATSRGYVGSIALSTGNTQWQHRVSATGVNAPAPIDEKRVAVSTTDGMVYVLEQTMLFNTLRFLNFTPPQAEQNTAYSYQFTSAGGQGQTVFFIREGMQVLPAGIKLDSITGELKGTPTQAGIYQFTVTALDQDYNYDARYIVLEVQPNTTGSSSHVLNQNMWSVFPNPVRSGTQLFVQFDASSGLLMNPTAAMEIFIYNSSGTLVRHIKEFHLGSPIQINHIPQGNYIITARQKNKLVFSKMFFCW